MWQRKPRKWQWFAYQIHIPTSPTNSAYPNDHFCLLTQPTICEKSGAISTWTWTLSNAIIKVKHFGLQWSHEFLDHPYGVFGTRQRNVKSLQYFQFVCLFHLKAAAVLMPIYEYFRRKHLQINWNRYDLSDRKWRLLFRMPIGIRTRDTLVWLFYSNHWAISWLSGWMVSTMR